MTPVEAAEPAASPSSQAPGKSTGELKAPTGALKSSAVLRLPIVSRAARRGFTIRLAELIVLLTAIVGATALGLGMIQYFAEHLYVAAYLIAYVLFRFADLLMRDETALGLDRERFMQRVLYEIPVLVLFFAAPFERTDLWGGDAPLGLGGLGLLLELVGLWLALFARVQLGFFSAAPGGDGKAVLVRNWLYRFIRHPIYLGELIVLLAWPFVYGAPITLIVAAVLGAFVIRRRIRLEEAELLARFGDDYAEYMRATDRLIPNVW